MTGEKVQYTKNDSSSAAAIVQCSLAIGAVNDPLEHEADAMADKVMRMQEVPTLASSGTKGIQRKCSSCEDEEKVQRKPLSTFIQRKEAAGGMVASPTVTSQINATKGNGSSMDNYTQTFMQSRFGADFSDVKIHTGKEAIHMNRELNAKAFTVGNDIYFNEGQFSPESQDGKKLLAHELTHTIQQNSNIATRKVQRLVRTSLVTCPAGQNPYGADRRASALLTNALTTIDAAVAARAGDPANADVVNVSNAMRSAFRLNPANASNWNDAAPHFGIPLIRRRIESVKNYIDSVVFTITCGAAGAVVPLAGCGGGTVTCSGPEAWSCHVNPTNIVLCPPFWALSSNQRARTFMHEIFHITFHGIDDWANPDSTNAHCYAQFVALLNGFNSPAGFRCH